MVLLVTSFGKIPGFHSANKQFMWVDRNGKPAQPPPEEGDLKMDILDKEVNNSEKNSLFYYVGMYHVQVSMTIEPGMELGISIRGGAEHGLGIYVSVVDPASVADLHGIQVSRWYSSGGICMLYMTWYVSCSPEIKSLRSMELHSTIYCMAMQLKHYGQSIWCLIVEF